MSTEPQCPLGGPRCHEAICDCFIDQYPADPLGLHPEAYVVGTERAAEVTHVSVSRFPGFQPGDVVVGRCPVTGGVIVERRNEEDA